MSYIKCLQQAVDYRTMAKSSMPWLDTPDFVHAYDEKNDILTCYSSPYMDCDLLCGVFEFSPAGIRAHLTVPASYYQGGKPILKTWLDAVKGGKQ